MAFIQVPEYKIYQTIELFEEAYGSKPTYLLEALEIGAIIRKEGLTPFYILHEEEHTIIATSEEQMLNKLN